jgi:hypothetical protein
MGVATRLKQGRGGGFVREVLLPRFLRGSAPPGRETKMETVRRERIIAISLMAACVYLAWEALDFPMDGSYFPLFALAGIFFLSLYLLVLSFFAKGAPAGEEKKQGKEGKELSYRPFVLFGILILQLLFVREIGYFVSTALFLIAASLYLGIRNYRLLIFTVLILIPSMYLLFIWGLQANLPPGVLF